MIEMQNLSFGYSGGDPLLADMSLTLQPGSFHFLTGPSGAGKSTLATNLAGYFARRGGRVMLGDVDRQAALEQRVEATTHLAGGQRDRVGHLGRPREADTRRRALSVRLARDRAQLERLRRRCGPRRDPADGAVPIAPAVHRRRTDGGFGEVTH